jgi:peptide deformylase
MSSLRIIEYPHKGLREIARPITVVDDALRQAVDTMFALMYQAGLVGLAAPQVALSQRFFVMDVSRHQDEGLVLINPEIIAESNYDISEEGCGSVPGVYAKIERPSQLSVRYQDLEGQTTTREFEGLAAFCIHHETEHLNGILFIDHLSKLKRHFIQKKLEKSAR